MGQNIGTGGRAWGKILGPCEEYTGVSGNLTVSTKAVKYMIVDFYLALNPV